eukprot:scaffold32901_cov176-Amphora_coffeaeformis.AAC.1
MRHTYIGWIVANNNNNRDGSIAEIAVYGRSVLEIRHSSNFHYSVLDVIRLVRLTSFSFIVDRRASAFFLFMARRLQDIAP